MGLINTTSLRSAFASIRKEEILCKMVAPNSADIPAQATAHNANGFCYYTAKDNGEFVKTGNLVLTTDSIDIVTKALEEAKVTIVSSTKTSITVNPDPDYTPAPPKVKEEAPAPAPAKAEKPAKKAKAPKAPAKAA